MTSLSFEGGNEIYRIVAPDWDGEDEQFTVRDLSDLEHIPNLESLVDTVLVDVDHAPVLLKLSKLSSVDLQYGSSIRDETTMAALEQGGVRIENKALEEKPVKSGPDQKLRLALDYSRAQELLWDEDKPAAALELLEKILEKNPRDALFGAFISDSTDFPDKSEPLEIPLDQPTRVHQNTTKTFEIYVLLTKNADTIPR